MLRPVAIVFLRELFLLLVLNLLPVRRLMPRESMGSMNSFQTCLPYLRQSLLSLYLAESVLNL